MKSVVSVKSAQAGDAPIEPAMTAPFSLKHFVPGGVLPDDHWHILISDDTCSRCRKPIPEDQVPLMLWSGDGSRMLSYCETCLGGPHVYRHSPGDSDLGAQPLECRDEHRADPAALPAAPEVPAMTNDFYILKDKFTVPVRDVLDWARWFETADRCVARDVVDGAVVSTVFLGTNHQFGDGPPLLFETMVFGGPMDQCCDRYASWDEAAAGHVSIVVQVTLAGQSQTPRQ